MQVQVLFVGIVCAVVLGAIAHIAANLRRSSLDQPSAPDEFAHAASIVRRPDLVAVHSEWANGLERLARYSDSVLHELAEQKLAAISKQVHDLGEGRLVFFDTESWRSAYERVLRVPGLKRYRSVAWLRNEDYWRDTPGRHSMQLNYDLISLGLRIERTLIINDFFWPHGAVLPAKVICRWIDEQYQRGIVIRLVRESEIAEETDLLCDSGIYGERATGILELDEQCRSVRFTLDFDPKSIRLADERWGRLILFSTTYRELLDRRIRSQ
jgi:hypothetical protein